MNNTYNPNKKYFGLFNGKKSYYFDPLSKDTYAQLSIKILFIEITFTYRKENY